MGIASSKREAREFISSGAISINGEKSNRPRKTIDQKYVYRKYIHCCKKEERKITTLEKQNKFKEKNYGMDE